MQTIWTCHLRDEGQEISYPICSQSCSLADAHSILGGSVTCFSGSRVKKQLWIAVCHGVSMFPQCFVVFSRFSSDSMTQSEVFRPRSWQPWWFQDVHKAIVSFPMKDLDCELSCWESQRKYKTVPIIKVNQNQQSEISLTLERKKRVLEALQALLGYFIYLVFFSLSLSLCHWYPLLSVTFVSFWQRISARHMGVVETLGLMSSEELAAFGLIEAVLADFFFSLRLVHRIFSMFLELNGWWWICNDIQY